MYYNFCFGPWYSVLVKKQMQASKHDQMVTIPEDVVTEVAVAKVVTYMATANVVNDLQI